jgi:hypothetical protein
LHPRGRPALGDGGQTLEVGMKDREMTPEERQQIEAEHLHRDSATGKDGGPASEPEVRTKYEDSESPGAEPSALSKGITGGR